MTEFKTKTWNGYLIHNWKENTLKLRKTKPVSSAPYEIVQPLTHKVKVPKIDIEELVAVTVLEKANVKEVVFDLGLEEKEEFDVNPGLIADSGVLEQKLEDWRSEAVPDREEELAFLKELLAKEINQSDRDDMVSFLMEEVQRVKER